MPTPIKHVFVLMMENRSFDHMLGFSGITGTDAETGQPATINGLNSTESNSFKGRAYPVTGGAADRINPGPGHDFGHVLEQLCGEGVRYPIWGAPNAVGDPAGYVLDDTQHVVYRGNDNHIHELWWSDSEGWRHGGLTSATGAPNAAGDPAGYVLGGTQHVVYRGNDNHIHELWWSDSEGWGRGDLTSATGAPNAAGDPAGYVLGGTQHVVYRGSDNHIHELSWSVSEGWGRGDLTSATGAPNAAGDPAGYVLGGTQHVVYRGSDNHIHELWWDQGWGRGDLTSATGAPNAAGDPAGYVLGGTQHVVYRGSDNHIHELWWDQGWGRGDLTSATGAPNAAGDPAGYVLGGTQHVVYRGSDNHIHELWWDQGWGRGDLTSATGAPNAAGDPAGYVLGGTQHVVYRGSGNHIHELSWSDSGGWRHGDLTSAIAREYPPINCSGYASSYAKRKEEFLPLFDGPRVGPEGAGNVMKCFTPDQLPVLNALAREFVVCDRWFSSLPGPTEPNRMFMYAETSGDFDCNMGDFERPSQVVIPDGGLKFPRGTVFGLLKQAGVKYRIYGGDSFPTAAWLDGVSVVYDIKDFEDFAEDVNDPSFDAGYVHIEPDYDAIFGFRGGNSQHPHGSGSVAAGERLIKAVYEAVRSSPVWEKSLLIITWDEHGGFYDHVIPPSAQGTGERGRERGFTFDQLGPRVPAVVVSPLIPRNLIDHRVYDHTAIPATLRRVFALPSLGGRDGITGGVDHLAGSVARTDAPMRLPNAAIIGAPAPAPRNAPPHPTALISKDLEGVAASTLNSALVQHLEVTPPEQHAVIRARVKLIRTHADAFAYLEEVKRLVDAKRVEAGLVHA
ncbi:hypothetical protein V1286_007706 [Bradyrhizobium algeriense]|uniref:Phosphoesterase n=1 Tax=Bradyrhizobium algeriense TaxID=634784 RepID=A0ABU8BNN9_9BRAD